MSFNWKQILIVVCNIIVGIYLILAVTAFNKPAERATVCSEVKIDIDDEDSLISQLNLGEARAMLDGGTLTSGMIPKIRSIVEALESGVHDVRIMNGTFPHALLLECFTDAGRGTVFYQD